MNRAITFLKSIHLSRVVTACVVSLVLFLSTACSDRVEARTPDIGNRITPGQAQPYRGGMNNFSDTDPRMDTSGAQAKAKALKDQVRTNIREKRADSVDQYVDNYRNGAPIQERTRKLGEDISRGAQKATQDAKNLGDEVSRNTQRTLDANAPATRDFRGVSERPNTSLKKPARGAADDVASDAKSATDKAARYVKDQADNVARNTRQAVDNAADAID